MKRLSDKISYLRGLIDGMNISDASKARLLRTMLSVLEDFSDEIEDIKFGLNKLNPSVNSEYPLSKPSYKSTSDFDSRYYSDSLVDERIYKNYMYNYNYGNSDFDSNIDLVRDNLKDGVLCKRCGRFIRTALNHDEQVVCPYCNYYAKKPNNVNKNDMFTDLDDVYTIKNGMSSGDFSEFGSRFDDSFLKPETNEKEDLESLSSKFRDYSFNSSVLHDSDVGFDDESSEVEESITITSELNESDNISKTLKINNDYRDNIDIFDKKSDEIDLQAKPDFIVDTYDVNSSINEEDSEIQDDDTIDEIFGVIGDDQNEEEVVFFDKEDKDLLSEYSVDDSDNALENTLQVDSKLDGSENLPDVSIRTEKEFKDDSDKVTDEIYQNFKELVEENNNNFDVPKVSTDPALNLDTLKQQNGKFFALDELSLDKVKDAIDDYDELEVCPEGDILNVKDMNTSGDSIDEDFFGENLRESSDLNTNLDVDTVHDSFQKQLADDFFFNDIDDESADMSDSTKNSSTAADDLFNKMLDDRKSEAQNKPKINYSGVDFKEFNFSNYANKVDEYGKEG